MDCLSLRSNHARFESCPTSKFLICKSKTLFESASYGLRCARITSDRIVILSGAKDLSPSDSGTLVNLRSPSFNCEIPRPESIRGSG